MLGVKSEVLLREIEKRWQKKQVQDREEDSVDVWFDNDYEEKELLRVLVMYGGVMLRSDWGDISLAEWVFFELNRDDIGFDNPANQVVYNAYCDRLAEGVIPDSDWFLRSEDGLVSGFVINNVDGKGKGEEKDVNMVIQRLVFGMKERKLGVLIKGKQEALGEDDRVMDEVVHLISIKNRVSGIFSQLYRNGGV